MSDNIPVDEALEPTSNGQNVPATPEVPAEAFLEFTAPDGKKETWKSKEELLDALKGSYLRQSDYTRKTQANAALRKQLEEERRQTQEMMKSIEEKGKNYEPMDRFLKQRPDVYQDLKQKMASPPSPDVAYQRAEEYTNQKYEEMEQKYKELEEWKREQELREEKTQLFREMKKEFPDLDEQAINEKLDSLADGGIKALMRTLYYAHKGEKSPVEIQQEVVNNLKQKEKAAVLPGSGTPSSKEHIPASMDEAENLALKDAGG